jgi:hypothetical protein
MSRRLQAVCTLLLASLADLADRWRGPLGDGAAFALAAEDHLL